MDVINSSPTSDLHTLVNRPVIGDRMEIAYRDGAKHELSRRASLSDVDLLAHLTECAKWHMERFTATRDRNYLRWATQLQDEVCTLVNALGGEVSA